MTSAACVENATKPAQMEKEIPCICPLGGYYLFYSNGTGHKKGVACGKCSRGKFSSGNATNCEPCQNGYAAVPGIYVKEWPKADPFVPHHFTTSCSGKYCRGVSTLI